MFTELFDAITSLRPKAQFVLRDNYEGLEWLDTEQDKPTKEEVFSEMARLKALELVRIAGDNRRAAYIKEADPLFFKAQRGEATMEEWQAKVAEIKTRFPKE